MEHSNIKLTESLECVDMNSEFSSESDLDEFIFKDDDISDISHLYGSTDAIYEDEGRSDDDVPHDSDVESDTERPYKQNDVLAHKNFVQSFDESLDEKNYNLWNPSVSYKKSYSCTLEKETSFTPSKVIVWTNEKPKNIAKYNKNKLKTKAGPINGSNLATTHFDAWKLFMTDEMLEHIVSCTNQHIDNFISTSTMDKKALYVCDFKHLTSQELTAFIGLIYARGLLKMTNQDSAYLFHDSYAHPVFGAVMSSKRFKFLMANVQFDDAKTHEGRFAGDNFAAVRELFEKFNDRCSSVLQPDGHLALDETLYGCRNNFSFKMYKRGKSQKYGLLFKSITAVRYPFTFRTSVYCGEPVGFPGPYYITDIVHVVQSLVYQLSKNVDLQGQNITMDSIYTSIELLEWLLSEKITAVGAIKISNKCIPNEVRSINGREDNSYKCYWEKENNYMTLHSYVVPTKSKDVKNVLALSTMAPILGTIKDNSKSKPAVFKFYDLCKRGTDINNRRMKQYTVNMKSRSWTTTAFAYILDMMRVNAQTMHAINTNVDPLETDLFLFGWELVLQLVKPHIITRKNSVISFSNSIMKKIDILLNDEEHEKNNEKVIVSKDNKETNEQFPKISDKRKRCHLCLEKIRGQPGSTLKRTKITRSKVQCQTCAKATCNIHSVLVCSRCK